MPGGACPSNASSGMLGTVGFEIIDQVESDPRCLVKSRLGNERCVSLVARRFAGEPLGLNVVSPTVPIVRVAA